MSGWISVEERLPESGKWVLARQKFNYSGKSISLIAHYVERWTIEADPESDVEMEYDEEKDAFYVCQGWFEQQANWDEYSSIHCGEGPITHWMPLPLPPGPGGE